MTFLNKIKKIFFDYKKIFSIVKVKNKKYVFVICLTFITVLLDAVGIGMLLPIGEYVLNYQKGSMPDTPSWKILKDIFKYIGIEPNIFLIVFSVIFIIVIRQIVTFIRVITIDNIKFQAIKVLREKLFSKFLSQDTFFVKQQNTGAHNNIINLEVEKLGIAVIGPLDNISGFIMIVSYLVLMMIVSFKATLVVCFCIFFVGVLLKGFLYYIKKLSTNIIFINNRFSQNIVDRLMASKLIKLTNMIEKEKTLNKYILNDQYLNNLKLARIQKLIDTSIEPLLLMITVPVIMLAIKFDFQLAKLGVFIILIARFIPVFKVTLSSLQTQVSFYASIQNMLNLIHKVDKQKEIRSGNKEVPKDIKHIDFQNIFFSYDNTSQNILEDFTCTFRGKKINALIGSSGKGKTTLVNMIPRLIEPQKGQIKINNLPLNSFKIDKVRNLCTYIEQKPSFIRGTIIEHISYGNSDISLKKVKEAAKLANAYKFITELDQEFYHKLGESGIGLSGGQLQRLEITRGIASQKPIMILDEPTSSLDIKNRDDILLTLKKINKTKEITIIIVTHDAKVLKYCDHIIKM